MATSIRSYGIWYRSGLLLVGLAANALGVALVTQAHLGTSPIAAIPYGMSLVLPGLSLGEWTIIFGLLLTIAQMVIEPSIPQWGSLGVQTVLGSLFGYAIDLFMPLAIRVSPTGYIPSLVMLLIGCVVIAVVVPGLLRILVFVGLCVFSVRCVRGVVESGHVRVAACGPLVGGDVAYSRADGHQGRFSVGGRAHDAGSTPYLPVRPFDRVVRTDPPAMLTRIIVERVGGGLPDALPQARGGLVEFPVLHPPGHAPGLGRCGFPVFRSEDRLQRVGGPPTATTRDLREHVSFQMRHAAPMARLGQQPANGGDRAGASIAHRRTRPGRAA